MFEIADRLLAAVDAGRTLAVATAISIEGSAPRTVGTSMAFDGVAVIGSIAGGCVEGAVVETCELVLADGVARTIDFGITDETAVSVGLTCGGQLRVHVQPLDGRIADSLRAGERVDVCAEYTDVARPGERMIILGAMEYSAALAAAASVAGFRVTVCDPRSLFATPERFPTAEIVVEWPTDYLRRAALDESTVVCVLSHDWRFDAESLAVALASPARYVGAMGSRVTADRRAASLRDLGVPQTSIARLHSPIGLDLAASSPEETAISILAEVLQTRRRTSARPLVQTTGSIHRAVVEVTEPAPAVSV